MYKYVIRAAPRRIIPSQDFQNFAAKRLLSTATPIKKSRSWKSSAVRWGLAIGGIYYYNTSDVFAEEPEAAIQRLDESIHHVKESSQPTIDAIVQEKRQRQAQRIAEEHREEIAAKASLEEEEEVAGEDEGLGGLEEEADQQGAFNPETGEINWDCPCLGGMAHGPCGEEFKAAFSCFVYSNEEPKGVECIDKFKGMQDCFRQHPETYASEFEDDEEEVEEELRARQSTPTDDSSPPKSSQKEASPSLTPLSTETPQPAQKVPPEIVESKPVEKPQQDVSNTTARETRNSEEERDEPLPKAARDATP